MQQHLFQMAIILRQSIEGSRGIREVINRADHPLRLNAAVGGNQVDQTLEITGEGIPASKDIQFLLE